MRQRLNAGRDLVTRCRRGDIEVARQDLGQMGSIGGQFVALVQQLERRVVPQPAVT